MNLVSLSFLALERTSNSLSSLSPETSLLSRSSHALEMNLATPWTTMVITQPCKTWTVCAWDLMEILSISRTQILPFFPPCLAHWMNWMTVWTVMATLWMGMLWAQCWRLCWTSGAWEMNCSLRREENARSAGNNRMIRSPINTFDIHIYAAYNNYYYHNNLKGVHMCTSYVLV